MTVLETTRGWIGRLARRARAEDGMTIAEVMIAMLVLAAGSLAVLNLISSAAHSSFRNEQSQVVSNRLQQEMESIEQLPYSQIALTGLPADSTDPNSPASRVSGGNYAIAQNGTNFHALVYNGSGLYPTGTVSGGTVNPTPTPFTSGDVSGTVYRYVVWDNDSTCSDTDCPGSQDLKRVIVAIDLDTGPAGGARHYQELQTQVTDPAVKPPDPGAPPCQSGCTDTAKSWSFWLTDTTCNNSTRQDITADHLVHNTNGICGAGLKNSTNCTTVLLSTTCAPGAPDLMVTNAPPLLTENPLFDYATDIEPAQNPDQDKGLQMPPPSSNGCLSSLFQPLTNVSGALVGDPDSTRMQTIHKWLSPPMGTGFNVTLNGKGTLNLWTQSINGASYNGKICVWLFERHLNVLGVPVDTPAVNLDLGNLTYFTYSQNPWPTGWTELHIPMNFNLSVNLGPSSQLGLALQVEKQGTTGGGMQFMYDEPSFDSRLEVKTVTTLLPF
jgi:Tfp pilus assembly protein PilV